MSKSVEEIAEEMRVRFVGPSMEAGGFRWVVQESLLETIGNPRWREALGIAGLVEKDGRISKAG